MFHIYLTIAYLYVLWRFVVPLPITRIWRAVIGLSLLIISKYHLILIGLYGTMFSPEFPRAAVLLAGWLFCTFVLLFALVILGDLVGGIVALVTRRSIAKVLGSKFRLVIASLALTLSGIGVYQAAQLPDVQRLDVDVKGLPAAFDGLRVVQLTDLHISKAFQREWVEKVVERTNALNPDLILVTGDVIDGTVEARREDVGPLANLKAPLGIIAIPGNHEYYFGADRWIAELNRLGMRVLVNSHVALMRDQSSLLIAGVTDEAAPAFGLEGPNLDRALKGADRESPVILLKHRPEGAALSATEGVSLQLSGHTHGGMIKGLDLIAQYANRGFVSGKYEVGRLTLYVSNGTALWNGFPIRLGVPAEITEIVLRASPASQLKPSEENS
ncbi:metallophosphoesterase [Pseudomonas sp. CNPSo 3701]|uniref:metallophosphoesterase n=1 Tax=Pseudomonas sp. CNPSo 3701 TaxID=3027943 RepID=UPI002364328E|nr:metallophosphoesterase [Pseudomonas sp. CNPSo 3701]MDD1507693.1 metallophosphoesterase [Pseudomonas sp. CNPSo 3701]